jgi:predicted dehydrogenase
MSDQVNVAVIGAGNMGRHHVRNYAEMDAVNLVAVVDPNPDVKEFVQDNGATLYSDVETMLMNCTIDAVSVVIPTPFHYEVAQLLLHRGIHVLIEKPIAATVEEAEKLDELAKQSGLILSVGHIERYNPVVIALRELIRGGSIGEISSIIARRLGGFPARMPQTDVILDLAIHDIDIFNFLTETDGTLIGTHGSRTFHTDQIDSAEILMKNGAASCFIQANWVTPVKIRRISVTGSKGYVEADYVTQEITHYESNVSPEAHSFEDFVTKFSHPDKLVVSVEKLEPLRRELEAFIAAIGGDKKALAISAEQATHSLSLAIEASQQLHALYERA